MQKVSTPVVFNGRAEAKKIEEEVKTQVKKLGVIPKLLVISFGDSKYLELKRRAAERTGIDLKIVNLLQFSRKLEDGIMIQMPVPKGVNLQKLINQIPPEKDVDGMRPACAGKDDSLFTTPVVLAVEKAINKAYLRDSPSVVVVGGSGFVGNKIVRRLLVKGLRVDGIDVGDDFSKLKKADVIISATGRPNLIKADMVKEGVVAIDLGAPKAEFERRVYKKAKFYTPVPGGIGPLTISYLLENVVRSVKIQPCG